MTRRTFKEKQQWILDRFEEKWERIKRTTNPPRPPSISASDESEEQAWHDEFGGQRIYYTMGGCISPDFARTLRKMYLNGILYRGTAGNEQSPGYVQKTYYVFYRLKYQCHEMNRKANDEIQKNRQIKRRYDAD